MKNMIKNFYLRLAGLALAAVLVGVIPGLHAEAVSLNSGNYEKWIDRINLSSKTYARDFYDWLVEESDFQSIVKNDGSASLADPGYNLVEGGMCTKTVASSSATVKSAITVTGNPSKDSENAYNAIESEVEKVEEEVVEYCSAAFHAFDRDNPQVFWLSGEFQFAGSLEYSYNIFGDVSYTVSIQFVLISEDFDIRSEKFRDVNDIIESINTTFLNEDSAVNKILAGCNDSMSDYEKVKYFNNTLTAINSYNADIYVSDAEAYECTSALNGRTRTRGPVCEGYANALKVLCDYADIPCVLVDGEAGLDGETGPHMWNYVQLDGAWYAVDTTWNDPYVVGNDAALSGEENENYLMVGSSTVIDGKAFIVSHPETNYCYNSYVYFTNGPVLNETAYLLDTSEPEPKPQRVVGDLNGDGKVNSLDSAVILKIIRSGVYVEEADINGDGRINALDSAAVLKIIKG